MSGPQVFIESDCDPRWEQAVPCAETLLRHMHPIQAIVSTNDVIQDWAQDQKIPWVARQDDLLSAVDGRPVCRSDRQRRGTAAAPTYRSSQSRCQ
jgi:hypothetical protein